MGHDGHVELRCQLRPVLLLHLRGSCARLSSFVDDVVGLEVEVLNGAMLLSAVDTRAARMTVSG